MLTPLRGASSKFDAERHSPVTDIVFISTGLSLWNPPQVRPHRALAPKKFGLSYAVGTRCMNARLLHRED